MGRNTPAQSGWLQLRAAARQTEPHSAAVCRGYASSRRLSARLEAHGGAIHGLGWRGTCFLYVHARPWRRDERLETSVNPLDGMTGHVECLLCGLEVSLGRECVFAVSENAALCFTCAVCRGGTYDEREHTWTRLPSLTGLHIAENGASERPFSSRPVLTSGSVQRGMPLYSPRRE